MTSTASMALHQLNAACTSLELSSRTTRIAASSAYDAALCDSFMHGPADQLHSTSTKHMKPNSWKPMMLNLVGILSYPRS